jgi:hypothetical protein
MHPLAVGRLLATATLAVVALAALACGDSDTAPLGPTPMSTATSGGAGGAIGSGGDEVGGAAEGGDVGQGGLGGVGGVGGTGGDGMVSTGGSQGACLSCGDYFTACAQGNCPAKAEVCQASFMLFSQTVGCVCSGCVADCQLTCTGVGSDTSSCTTCIAAAASSTCQSTWTSCQNN